MADRLFRPRGSHTTVSDISTVMSVEVPAKARAIMMEAFTQDVRFTLDGTDPTASKGFLLDASAVKHTLVYVEPGETIKFLEETANATLQYQFLG